MKLRRTLLSLSTALVLISAAQAEVKVGASLSITGPIASAMPRIQKAFSLAMKQVNDQGGFFKTGEKLELITADSACDPVAAVDAGKKLVDVNQVVAIVGPFCSGETIAQAQSVSIPAGVVTIAISATSPAITTLEKGTDLLFRVVASDNFQGAAVADLAIKKGMKELAVMYSNDDYNIGISKVFIDAYKAKGGKITAVQAFDPGKASYRSEVTTLGKDTKNLALFAYPGNAGIVILRNALESGSFSSFVAGDSMRNVDVIKQLGVPALKNMTVVSATSDRETKSYKMFEAAANEAQINPTEAYTANGYDALFVLALAIEKAGSTDRAKISPALRAVTSGAGEPIYPGEFKKAKEILAKGGEIHYMGVSSDMKFDANGDVRVLYGANTVSAEGQWVTTEVLK